MLKVHDRLVGIVEACHVAVNPADDYRDNRSVDTVLISRMAVAQAEVAPNT